MSDVNESILVVDDEAQTIQLLSNLLKPHYQIIAALSGNKAIELANSDKQPDLILLDIMLPDLDGFEVCNRLKNNQNTRDIPIIFITVEDQSDFEVKGVNMGVVDFITKPINPKSVLARVETHLKLTKRAGIFVSSNKRKNNPSRHQFISRQKKSELTERSSSVNQIDTLSKEEREFISSVMTSKKDQPT